MKNENNIELISPIGETCNKVDLKKAMVPICDEKLSPFASYVGDMHKLNKPKKNTTKIEADFLLEKGHIGDIEKAILMTINHLLKDRTATHAIFAQSGITAVIMPLRNILSSVYYIVTTGRIRHSPKE